MFKHRINFIIFGYNDLKQISYPFSINIETILSR